MTAIEQKQSHCGSVCLNTNLRGVNMKKFLIGLSMLGLTACDPFEGLLQVQHDFVIKSTETQPGCGYDGNTFGCDQIVNVAVPVGGHSSKLEFVGKDQIQITMKINGKKKYVKMFLPKKLDIPSQNGSFAISSADLGQDFSADGGIATNVTDSEPYRGNESCSYTRHEQVCQIVNNQYVCHDEIRTIYGQQYVEYFNRSTVQNINVNFVKNIVLSTFNGSRSSSEKIYTFKGQCY